MKAEGDGSWPASSGSGYTRAMPHERACNEGAKPRSYREFWPVYVASHRHPWTRRLHFAGTTGAIISIVAAALFREPGLLLVAAVIGYGFAWCGHAFVERNRPATFRHPWWSLIGDVHMYGLMWAGRMDAEVRRFAGVDRGAGAGSSANIRQH